MSFSDEPGLHRKSNLEAQFENWRAVLSKKLPAFAGAFTLNSDTVEPKAKGGAVTKGGPTLPTQF